MEDLDQLKKLSGTIKGTFNHIKWQGMTKLLTKDWIFLHFSIYTCECTGPTIMYLNVSACNIFHVYFNEPQWAFTFLCKTGIEIELGLS